MWIVLELCRWCRQEEGSPHEEQLGYYIAADLMRDRTIKRLQTKLDDLRLVGTE